MIYTKSHSLPWESALVAPRGNSLNGFIPSPNTLSPLLPLFPSPLKLLALQPSIQGLPLGKGNMKIVIHNPFTEFTTWGDTIGFFAIMHAHTDT